jgi:hypothetical protein
MTPTKVQLYKINHSFGIEKRAAGSANIVGLDFSPV